MSTSGRRDHKIEPEFLGPLGDRPLAETAHSVGSEELFRGATTFLAARHQRKRREQWNAVRPLVERLLRDEEHVLYVAHAMQLPPVLHSLALGAMALVYHQVLLVFTDTRLIEVLLEVRGKTASTRLRAFSWVGVREARMRFSKLELAPARGRKQGWKIPIGGDRKLLKLLLERMKPRLLREGAASAAELPQWHCPQCGAEVSPKPESCPSCRTSFRSAKLATLFSLAFPGAGLLYAGHPFLAFADFLGEVFLYLLFLLLIVEDPKGSVAVAAGIGVLMFILTKLESIHVSRILVERSKPETVGRRAGFQRLALIGGFASLLLIGGALPLAGAARKVVDRDLEVAEGENWRCSRQAQEWSGFADDPSARSECWSSSGAVVTMFAYPQGVLENHAEFRRQTLRQFEAEGMTVEKEDEDVPSPFRGFRIFALKRNEQGQGVSVVSYFILDELNHDIHQVLAAAGEEEGRILDEQVRELLAHSRWIQASPPVGLTAPAGK